MIRATAGQSIGAQMIDATDGSNFTGSVSVYITIDNGLQALGAVGAGLCTHEGQGYHSYAPSAAETDGAHVAFTFVGSGAITATVQVATVTVAVQAAISTSTATDVTTVRDIITFALRITNAVPLAGTPTPEELAEGFAFLNDLIESWQNDRLLIPYVLRTTWTISSTQGTLTNPYTVGSGGDIDVLRPTMGMTWKFQDTSVSPTQEYALDNLDDDAWHALSQKDATSTLPVAAYYNPTYVGFLGSLYLYPVPSQASLEGILYAPANIGKFGSVNDSVVLPPGYNRFLKFNLADEMAGVIRDSLPLDPRSARIAIESKAAIKRANMRPLEMSTGWGGVPYDINTQ